MGYNNWREDYSISFSREELAILKAIIAQAQVQSDVRGFSNRPAGYYDYLELRERIPRATHKEPIFTPERKWSNGIFDEVVKDFSAKEGLIPAVKTFSSYIFHLVCCFEDKGT